jgi:hypothetical protein
MRSAIRWTKRVAAAGLLAGSFLAPTGFGHGQGTPGVAGQPAAPASNPPAAIPSELLEPPPAGNPDGAPAGEEPKPFWATKPPVTPLPRLAFGYIPPTGCGYYSLRDLLQGNERQTTPKYPYAPTAITPFSFFDADFRYLDDPNNTQFDWLDFTKRIHLGDCWLLSVGGEERFRYMNEVDSRLNAAGIDNTYWLIRSRVYADLWYRDIFRVYAEFLDAATLYQDLTPAPIDKVKPTFLNLFADLKIFELDDGPVYLRGGRQELLYGSERLISPLDWANTRRTFQGVKGFWHTEDLDIDAFWVQPVVDNGLDYHYGPDKRQNFEALWTTYRPCKGRAWDFYYLNLDNSNHVARGQYMNLSGFNVSTLGTRSSGDSHNFLWDVEGMYQFGNWANQVTTAGAATGGVGYHFADLPLNPTFYVYYDWASGDPHPGTGGVHRTFNQLFPFGHYYFGGIDLIGRQNIHDLNFDLWLNPTKWITFGSQFHVLHLDSPKDALYNSGGTAILGTALTGAAKAVNGEATGVGNELVFITNFHLSPHQDIFLQYCKLYRGSFLSENGRGSPSLCAACYSFKW